jgi:hypothetical protein
MSISPWKYVTTERAGTRTHRLTYRDSNQVYGHVEERDGRFLARHVASQHDLGDFPSLEEAFEAIADFD